MTNTLKITLRSFPGSPISVEVPSGSTWADVMRKANLDINQHSGRVSGIVLTPESEFLESTVVLLTRASKSATAGRVDVQVRQFPGTTLNTTIDAGQTWGDVLRSLNLNPAQYSGRVNGIVLTEDSQIFDNVSILVTAASKSA